jgi:hypothetical protein
LYFLKILLDNGYSVPYIRYRFTSRFTVSSF